ncbi:MAG: RNA polymerase sigma factor [Deltaproteobacteria bacterium]|nr:RNA polymerase sigma factor [Deltaproteobacteria bacterium]
MNEPSPRQEDVVRPRSPEVIATLVDQHRRFLAFLERRVGNRAVAEEILQEAFVRSLDAASAIRDEESATAWFYRLLRRAVIDHWRRRGAERRALDRLALEPQEDVSAPDEELEEAVCACIGALVDTLKPEYAEAVRKVDLGGSSVIGYASESAITPSNAGVRLHRAREALRRRVAESCGTCATHGCMDCTCGGATTERSHGSTT